uniref:Protein MAINTENANCE OF MERISTEMS-like n=1 Tax=Cicer arietinum TaxID=3827 RepID=A0A1S2Y4I3_CICAR|nr:protein MAINTENANCE OF MERISTEMS-like [Cicer arietinum]
MRKSGNARKYAAHAVDTDDIHDVVAHTDDVDDIDEHDRHIGFPRGPMDRGSLKVITHGLKLKKFTEVLVPYPVEHWIWESGLLHLSLAYLTMTDVGLISAFVERWHKETISFHLPVVEMTITLDDVVSVLHISPHDHCRDYSWATATLVFLYDNMGDETVNDTRQLGGYMTLLECWIYEHFHRIGKWGDRGAILAHLPRACMWTAKHVVEGGLMTYRQGFDALLLEDVVFTPYDDDGANHSFTTIKSSVSAFRRLYPIATFPGEVVANYYAWYMSVSHPLVIPLSTIAPSSPPTVVAHAGPSSSAHAGPSSTRDRRAADLLRRAINLVAQFSESSLDIK